MKFRSFILMGAPGAGKGTQGRILGSVPGFFHMACGDVFRSLDYRSEIGRAFIDYSSKGQLVPDEIVFKLWHQVVESMIGLGRFKPEIDHLILDGIPRNVSQAQILDQWVHVRKVFHLSCPNRAELVERIRKRALKESRFDDASDEIIHKRLKTYEDETKPLLDYYGADKVVELNALKYPYQVLRDVLNQIDTTGTDFTI